MYFCVKTTATAQHMRCCDV